MLLRPTDIKSKHDSDVKDKGSSLSPSGPEAAHGRETSCCSESQESTRGDSTMQKAGQPDARFTVSQNHNEEFNKGPNSNRLILRTNEENYEKEAISWRCKQKLFYISLLKNPFFYIFTWSLLLSQLAYFIPTFHLVARAKTLGIDMMDASYLVSIAGKKVYFNLTLKRKKKLNFTKKTY